jgi:hypothetical protein
MGKVVTIVIAAVLGTGCATSFTGNPKIETGPAGCKSVCDAWGMELAGMVQMGEYSNGCVCQVRGRPLAVRDAATGALPAVTGVWMEMQRQNQTATAGGAMGPPPGSSPGGYRGY